MAHDRVETPPFNALPPFGREDLGAAHERTISTYDHEEIRQWAEQHDAEPATQEGASIKVHDGGHRLRFNFPAAAYFRRISWTEWFQMFDEERLMLVYAKEPRDRAPGDAYRIVKGDHARKMATGEAPPKPAPDKKKGRERG